MKDNMISKEDLDRIEQAGNPVKGLSITWYS